MKKISIMLIEDNRLLREGIAVMISKQSDMKVTSSFGDCSKALQSINGTEPDIILLDTGLRNQNSLSLVKVLKKNYPNIKIIVMDLAPMQEDVFIFVQAGVNGFILKDASIEEFLKTIRSVSNGEKILPSKLTESLFTQIINDAVVEADTSKIIESVIMTRRERQVIELVADGLSNKEIAQNLNLSPFTIKSHIHNILEKLTLHTRVQIAKYAHSNKKDETS